MFWVEVLDKPCFLLSHGGHRFLEAEGFPGGCPGDLLGVSWGSSGVSWCLLGSPGAWCKEQGLAKSSALIVRSRGACEWPCPECRRTVPEYALRPLLPRAIDRLQRASLAAAVAHDPDLFACPTPGCPIVVSLKRSDSAVFNCTSCLKISCLRCNLQPCPAGHTCSPASSQLDASLRQWAQDTGSKQCPTCDVVISKEDLASQAQGMTKRGFRMMRS